MVNVLNSQQWRERVEREHNARIESLAAFVARHRAFRAAVTSRDFVLANELLEEQRKASRGQ